MRASPCLALVLPHEARVALLLEDYHFFVTDTPAFCERLDGLRVLRGKEVVKAWQDAARAGHTERVVRELLTLHYDPIYMQSIQRNYPGHAKPLMALAWDGSAASLEAVAVQALAQP